MAYRVLKEFTVTLKNGKSEFTEVYEVATKKQALDRVKIDYKRCEVIAISCEGVKRTYTGEVITLEDGRNAEIFTEEPVNP